MSRLNEKQKAIKDLVVCSFKKTTPDVTKYSVYDVDEAAKAEIHELIYDYNSYEENKRTVFTILQESYDEVLPKYVEDTFGAFAEIKQVGHGEKATFKRKAGRQRAKQFITQVGLSGRYEAFRLDSVSFDVSAHAIGGAAILDFERLLSGDEDLSESGSLLLEGIQEALYGEVQRALMASINAEDRPAANSYVAANFDADRMAELCAVARAYGGGAVIFATPEFIASMGPDAIGMPVLSATTASGFATPVYSPKDINDIANTGYITTFRGNPIIQIPQSYTDETNTTTQINPGFAYIFPTGGEKVVKITMEGDTVVRDHEALTNEIEIQAYKKFGVAILTNHNWCIYENSALANSDTKYLPEN